MAFCELSKSMDLYEKIDINNMLLHLIKDYDVIFYVSPEGVKMEDNGVRETNKEYRLAIHEKISSILGMHRWMPGKIVKISGTTEERIKQVKDTVALYV